MRLIRLKLRGSAPFWIMKPINLQKGQETSPLINIDILTDIQKDVINQAINRQEVSIYDPDGNRIIGNLNNVNRVEGNRVAVDDVEEDEELYPEIISVTVTDEPEPEEPQIPEKTYKDADVLLSKNGNTIKKLISRMRKTPKNRTLLSVCLEKEPTGLNRQGVLNYIKKIISEY